jgi:hypothetical protein
MTTILERLDRMERDLSRLNQEVLDLRAEVAEAPAPYLPPAPDVPPASHVPPAAPVPRAVPVRAATTRPAPQRPASPPRLPVTPRNRRLLLPAAVLGACKRVTTA